MKNYRLKFRTKTDFYTFCEKFNVKISRGSECKLNKIYPREELLIGKLSLDTLDILHRFLVQVNKSNNPNRQEEVVNFLIRKLKFN